MKEADSQQRKARAARARSKSRSKVDRAKEVDQAKATTEFIKAVRDRWPRAEVVEHECKDETVDE